MALTKPNPFDPFGSGPSTSTQIVGPIVDWINQGDVNVKDAAYGAKGDNLTDDTAAFVAAVNAAAADNRCVYVPPGIYILNTLYLTTDGTATGGILNYVHMRGSGWRSSLLKAKAGAVAAVDLNGAANCTFEDLQFNGGGTTNAVGFRLRGDAAASGQIVWTRCWFTNATKGMQIPSSTGGCPHNQWYSCYFTLNATGLAMDNGNTQQQEFYGCVWAQNTTCIDLSSAGNNRSISIALHGGTFASYTTGIKFSGNISRLYAVDCNFQATGVSADPTAIDFDGTNGWAYAASGNATHTGVELAQCTFNGGGLAAASQGIGTSIIIGQSAVSAGTVTTPELHLRRCDFSYGVLSVTGTGVLVKQDSCGFYNGALYGRKVTDGVATGASATLTSATAAFTQADVGRKIVVSGTEASGAALVTTIASYNSATSVALTTAPTNSVNPATVTIGRQGVVVNHIVGGGRSWTVTATGDSAAKTNNTLADDDTLKFYMLASTAYRIEGLLFFNSANTTMDWQIGWSFPSSVTNLQGWGVTPDAAGGATGDIHAVATATTAGAISGFGTAIARGGANNATFGVKFEGVIMNSSAGGGTATLQWAQNTTDAGNLVRKAGSHIKITPLYSDLPATDI